MTTSMSISKASGIASLDAQSSEELVKRMFARAWEDGIITHDEHLLISEVVEFLGMHPERVKRISEEARGTIEFSPPEDIYLEMLSFPLNKLRNLPSLLFTKLPVSA